MSSNQSSDSKLPAEGLGEEGFFQGLQRGELLLVDGGEALKFGFSTRPGPCVELLQEEEAGALLNGCACREPGSSDSVKAMPPNPTKRLTKHPLVAGLLGAWKTGVISSPHPMNELRRLASSSLQPPTNPASLSA